MLKNKLAFPGIGPLPLQPYPKEGGKYKLILPPFLIKGTPNCHPFITWDNTNEAPGAEVFESNTVPSNNLPVYRTVTVEVSEGITPEPAAFI